MNMHSLIIRTVIGLFLLVSFARSMVLAQKEVLIVTTDIGQDPDDKQSLVRLLHYANEFKLAGLIANADANYAHESAVLRDSIIHQLINEYAKIEDNLRIHATGYPSSEYLHSLVKKGGAGNGLEIPLEQYVGANHDTEGSDWIVKVVRESSVPVSIAVWGGACDVAQALWKARHTLSEAALNEFVGKLRVFFINKQDSSNDWIIQEFPELWVVLAFDPAGDKWASGYRGMFLGGNEQLTSKEWLHEFIIGENPLASQYPDEAFTGGTQRNTHNAMKEGDSPSWLFFLNNGLNEPDHPGWGGWGGRYQEKRSNLFVDTHDKFYDEVTADTVISARATVYRWRPAFQRDFAARVQWGTKSYKETNHPPVPLLNNLPNEGVIRCALSRDDTLRLDASPSYDPDGDRLRFRWYAYPEAGTYNGSETWLTGSTSEAKTSVYVPDSAKVGETFHLLLEVTDDQELSLVGYRRLVIEVE